MAAGDKPDIVFHDHGTIHLMVAITPAGESWIAEHVGEVEGYQRSGTGIVVDHRCAVDIANGAAVDGLKVEVT